MSQNRITSTMASARQGSRSSDPAGAEELLQSMLRTGSKVQLLDSVSTKMIRAPE